MLDSDLLFFRRPQLLVDWLRAPDQPFAGKTAFEAAKVDYNYLQPILG